MHFLCPFGKWCLLTGTFFIGSWYSVSRKWTLKAWNIASAFTAPKQCYTQKYIMLWLPTDLHIICQGYCETFLNKRSEDVKGEAEKTPNETARPSCTYKYLVRLEHSIPWTFAVKGSIFLPAVILMSMHRLVLRLRWSLAIAVCQSEAPWSTQFIFCL